jgi:hypothetical protein
LNQILTPLRLAVRVVDETTFEITSDNALHNDPEVEFYPVHDMINSPDDELALMERVRRELRKRIPAQFVQPENLMFDSVSKCFIVRLPQAHQRELESLLRSSR